MLKVLENFVFESDTVKSPTNLPAFRGKKNLRLHLQSRRMQPENFFFSPRLYPTFLPDTWNHFPERTWPLPEDVKLRKQYFEHALDLAATGISPAHTWTENTETIYP